ncbi:zinc ribbon domain-containing protein [Actinospongicola halichondriae]|uniref:zinc ribbon domain-containing protein n=1 Tax=Actinospongicola halichondriae TaxID=3236844 RepID=UPI003D5058AC
MTTQWEQLLAVQALDTTIQQLDHRHDQIPERAELAALDEQLATLRKRIEDAEAAKADLVKAQKRLEVDIADIEAKIEHDNEQLYAGGSDPSVLQSLQHEIETRKGQISKLEDEELELMEQVEPIDEQLASLAQQRASVDEQAAQATAALATVETEIEAERAVAVADRAALITDIDPDALARYETARSRMGGIAVARLEGGVCGACHMKLSAVEHDRIQHLDPDAEIECEDCGRFLVRS